MTAQIDGSDNLISRKESAGGAGPKTRVYFYWGMGTTLAEETDGRGATLARYLVDGGDTLAQETYRAGADGHRDPTDTAGTWTWLLDDPSGNVATHVGDDGAVTKQAAFDPYGRPEKGGTGQSATAPGSTLGFQGAHTDPTTGSVILGPRQYDPTTARFTSPDVYAAGDLDLSLGTDELTGNRYLFAAANPVAYYEDGHWPCFKGVGWCDKDKDKETEEEKEARESRRRAFEDLGERFRNNGLTDEEVAECKALKSEAEEILGRGHKVTPERTAKYNEWRQRNKKKISKCEHAGIKIPKPGERQQLFTFLDIFRYMVPTPTPIPTPVPVVP